MQECGIAYGTGNRATFSVLPALTGFNYIFGGNEQNPCAIAGIALSPDESKLYFTSGTSIYMIPSAGGALTTLVTLTLPFQEFRGIAFPPQSCVGGVSPLAGYYCPGGAASGAMPCPPGTASQLPGAALTCSQCPAGTYSANPGSTLCSPCAGGIYCAAGSTSSVGVPCPAGSFCAAGSGAVVCGAGNYCPAGSSVGTNICPPGFYCPNAAAPSQCPVATWSSTAGASTSAVCISCNPGLTTVGIASELAACIPCPIGYYTYLWGANAQCLPCPQGVYCPKGSQSNTTAPTTTCPVGWYCTGVYGGTAQCPSGTYSASTGAIAPTTCLNCNPGSWCPVGSWNTTTNCIPGWQCPGGGVANSVCGVGYFSPAAGASSCTPCPAGALSTVIGATSCVACPLGTFAESGAQTLTCTPCPAYTYSNTPGLSSQSSCTPCPLGYSSLPGSTSCQITQWAKLNPTFPLTPRQTGITGGFYSNGGLAAQALLAVGGRNAAGAAPAPALQLGYDAISGLILESAAPANMTANLTFDRSASAPHPTDGSVYVFGGVSATGSETNSLWRVVAGPIGQTPAVTAIPFAAPAPSPRKLAGMAYLSPCPAMTGACLVVLGGDLQGALLGDVWVFDLTLSKWSQPTGLNLNMPSPRSGHVVTASPNQTMLYVFGGTTATGITNDIFALAPFGFWNSQPSEMTNVAQGRPASISAIEPTLGWRGPGAAVDGILTTRMTEVANPATPATCNCDYCAQTPTNQGPSGTIYGPDSGTSNPWWGVDLGASVRVDFLYLYMRQPNAAGQYTYGTPCTPRTLSHNSPFLTPRIAPLPPACTPPSPTYFLGPSPIHTLQVRLALRQELWRADLREQQQLDGAEPVPERLPLRQRRHLVRLLERRYGLPRRHDRLRARRLPDQRAHLSFVLPQKVTVAR